jgi:hypothetical protein
MRSRPRLRHAVASIASADAAAADFHVAVTAGVDELAHLPLAPIDPADAELAIARTKASPITSRTWRSWRERRSRLEAVAKLGVYTNTELLRATRQ